jgi:hypothetical protein
MKDLINLWEKLEAPEGNIKAISRDWSEGKVPELPYQIIGQDSLKLHIRKKLENIDGNRMTSTVLRANYGDGKTNTLKYLQLYFNNHPDLGMTLLYCRANPDQTDLCMFLMGHIEANFRDAILNHILKLRKNENVDPAHFAHDYKNDFSFIQDYVNALFNKEYDKESLINLIYLGTGRLYSQRWFEKFSLKKLSDFNRREIFVFFMNILADAGIYIIFAIDELEKINDKSSKRMSYYLSSYRELLDLFSMINGHYMISAITLGVDIDALCPPLSGRIKDDIVMINRLSSKCDLEDLVRLISELLGLNTSEDDLKQIASKLIQNKKLNNNRLIVQETTKLLNNLENDGIGVDELLKNNSNLSNLFDETKEMLSKRQAFDNLSRSYFDPLSYYLDALGYPDVKSNVMRRDFQAFIVPSENKAFMFLFNDNSKVKSRIQELHDTKGINTFVLFVPEEMSLSYADIDADDIILKMHSYDPKQTFILLNMYRQNLDKQSEISDVLSAAFNSLI